MARKKKPASKAGTRRTPRRGKQATAAEAGETSAAADTPVPQPPVDQIPIPPETSTSSEPTTSNPQASSVPGINPRLVPTVVLHKKFGKYRCLFSNDDAFTKKYDLGSDSETNSSVEIRVVDLKRLIQLRRRWSEIVIFFSTSF